MFPLINGELTFQIGAAIKAYTLTKDEKDYWKELKVPLSIIQKKKTSIEFPVRAEQRGVARIKNISYDFPHLLNFNRLRLRYYDFYQTEFIVYPTLLPVHGVNAVFHMMPGESRLNYSPFEDAQSPLGTRDYSYSDPFHKINWKATVKTQKMQTNIYEKVVDRTFVFIINLATENDKNMVRAVDQTSLLVRRLRDHDRRRFPDAHRRPQDAVANRAADRRPVQHDLGVTRRSRHADHRRRRQRQRSRGHDL